METQLKTGRAALDQLREDRSAAPANWPSCTPISSILKQAAWPRSTSKRSLRADAEIVRLLDEELVGEEETCRTLKQRIEQMGPVNMMALDEYKETAERHGFLETQRKDLMESIENTQETIKEIDQISRNKFDEAFAASTRTSPSVFRGSSAAAGLPALTDDERTAESGLEIVARPRARSSQHLLLSGGEKSLTALALLVGIFQFQPSPFCVLDEVDAALDETNVGRFTDLVRSMSSAHAVPHRHPLQDA